MSTIQDPSGNADVQALHWSHILTRPQGTCACPSLRSAQMDCTLQSQRPRNHGRPAFSTSWSCPRRLPNLEESIPSLVWIQGSTSALTPDHNLLPPLSITELVTSSW